MNGIEGARTNRPGVPSRMIGNPVQPYGMTHARQEGRAYGEALTIHRVQASFDEIISTVKT